MPFSDEIAAATYRDTSVVVAEGSQIGWFPRGVGRAKPVRLSWLPQA